MITETHEIRVRYGETDKMGYVYYGNYPLYFEVGRTELMRKLGFPYSFLEKNNIMLPVKSLNVKYYKPAYYDDKLTVKTTIKEMPAIRIHFYYEIFNDREELLTEGETTLVFIDSATRKPRKIPNHLAQVLKPFFT